MTFMYNYHRGNLPDLFQDFFITNREIHERNTRSQNEIREPMYKSRQGCNFIKKTGAKLWNQHSGLQLDKVSLAVCKNTLRTLILEEY